MASPRYARWRGRAAALLVVVTLVAIAVIVPSLLLPADAAQPTRIAVSIDNDSSSMWSRAVAGAPSVAIIVVNPSGGPGIAKDETLLSRIQMAQGRGLSVLGYVPTSWAGRNASLVQAEGLVSDYYSWYHVNGVFLDQVNDTCYTQPFKYYAALYSQVKAVSPGDLVVLNPGRVPGECYTSISDIMVTFDSSYDQYWHNYTAATWTSSYQASRFMHVVYSVPTGASIGKVVSLAQARGAGWIFMTDFGGYATSPNGVLPTFFSSELAAVSGADLGSPLSFFDPRHLFLSAVFVSPAVLVPLLWRGPEVVPREKVSWRSRAVSICSDLASALAGPSKRILPDASRTSNRESNQRGQIASRVFVRCVPWVALTELSPRGAGLAAFVGLKASCHGMLRGIVAAGKEKFGSTVAGILSSIVPSVSCGAMMGRVRRTASMGAMRVRAIFAELLVEAPRRMRPVMVPGRLDWPGASPWASLGRELVRAARFVLFGGALETGDTYERWLGRQQVKPALAKPGYISGATSLASDLG